MVTAIKAMRAQVQNEPAPGKNAAETPQSKAPVQRPPLAAVDNAELQSKFFFHPQDTTQRVSGVSINIAANG